MATRVMIVDDSMHWRMELRYVLMSGGFSVVGEASNGRDALDMYEKLQPDVVMVDAQMPDMDGVSTIREIWRKDQDALMILCASSGEKWAVVEALSAGAKDFCAKPYVPRNVATTIRKVLVGLSH